VRKLLFALIIIIVTSSFMAPPGSKEILKQMHDRYSGKWYKTFSFNQTTEMYRNDSLKRSQIWYENIQFPNNFRIDFGNPDSGNALIFKNDSSYLFTNSKRVRVDKDENDLTFLLGGMYFYPFEEVIKKMKTFGYDLKKFHEDTWKQKEVYVIGAAKGEDSINQIWVDKEKLNVVRMIKFDGKQKEEGLFEKQVKLSGGYSESLVHFYINDTLIQVEKYHDMKANIEINASIFDTENFIKLKK
jgi:outer membrane lipoprotein-sorting protein